MSYMFSGYTDKEQRLLVEHQMEVLRRKVAGNPMTAEEEMSAAKKVLGEVDLMWYAANEGFKAMLKTQQQMIDGEIKFGVLRPPPAKITVVS